MPFSAAPSISQAQQLAFINTWKSSAQSAASQLGIPWQWVMAQWAMESGWGTQPGMGANNPGNVGRTNGGWTNYGSQKSFVSAYVSAMRTDFAHQINAIQVSRVSVSGRGGPPEVTLSDFFNGPQSYDHSTTTYGNLVGSVLPTVESLTGTTAGNANPNSVASEPNKVSPSWLSSLESWVSKELLFVALVLGLLVLLILMAAKGLGLIGGG